MAATTVAPSPRSSPERVRTALVSLRPKWSVPAAFRALRSVIVIPPLFAIVTQVIHNSQIPLYAIFGSFAALVIVDFHGSKRQKLIAHLAFGVAGTAMIPIGTAVSSSAALASPIALLVVFVVLMAGIFGTNAASGTTGVLVAFVLPAATPGGTIADVPWRIAGWWLAMAAGTIAVLVLSPRPAGDRLRSDASRALAALSTVLGDLGSRRGDDGDLDAARTARDGLVEDNRSAPARPIGVGAADQAIADLAETVQWIVSLIDDIAKDNPDLSSFDETDLVLLTTSATVLRDAGLLLAGGNADLPLAELDTAMRECVAKMAASDQPIQLAYHARMIAIAARTAALDALTIVRRRSLVDVVEGEREGIGTAVPPGSQQKSAYLSAIYAGLRIHSGLASTTFLNAVRGAIAVAAAVAIADLTNVQHGFWVVLGTLSVLRTSAVSIGVNAWRAIVGTAVGFAIGAAILVGVGSNTDALWAIFPVVVVVATYSPGTAPFAVGQAGFTIMLTVVYNLIAPVGWSIGVVRVEDIAIGVGVSVVAGLLFWPRGAGRVVRDDLADALHYDGLFLVQSTAWALGLRTSPPDAGVYAARSDIRLSDAMRAVMAEQGPRRVPRDEAWRLVSGVGRLRSTARSLAVALHHPAVAREDSTVLLGRSVRLAGLCDAYASRIANRPPTAAQELAGLPAVIATDGAASGYGRWVGEHLDDVRDELQALAEPVGRVAETAKVPWWR